MDKVLARNINTFTATFPLKGDLRGASFLITGVVLDYEKNTLSAVGCLDCFINLIRCRRGEYCTGNRTVQHTFSYEAAMSRFMSASASGDQCYFSIRTAGTNQYFQSRQTLNVLRASCYHAIKHFVYYIVDLINQFLHITLLFVLSMKNSGARMRRTAGHCGLFQNDY